MYDIKTATVTTEIAIKINLLENRQSHQNPIYCDNNQYPSGIPVIYVHIT